MTRLAVWGLLAWSVWLAAVTPTALVVLLCIALTVTVAEIAS